MPDEVAGYPGQLQIITSLGTFWHTNWQLVVILSAIHLKHKPRVRRLMNTFINIQSAGQMYSLQALINKKVAL